MLDNLWCLVYFNYGLFIKWISINFVETRISFFVSRFLYKGSLHCKMDEFSLLNRDIYFKEFACA